jgi:hypothetical protein
MPSEEKKIEEHVDEQNFLVKRLRLDLKERMLLSPNTGTSKPSKAY